MIRNVNFYDDILSIMTELGSTAELSRIQNISDYEGDFKPINYDGQVYFFNRIKTKKEGIGEGRLLMQKIIEICDKEKINIVNYLNPYGERNLTSLKRFFKNSDFFEVKHPIINSLMFRKFKNNGI